MSEEYTTKTKFERLERLLAEMGRVVVAYSGGVDSTLLLKLAHDVLREDALGITAVSPSLAAHEREEAARIARDFGMQHLELVTHEVEDPRYLANPANRCYFCRQEVFSDLAAYAQAHNFAFVLDGTNLDDAGDHRPGRQAARELGVRSPFLEAGITKAEIRARAHALGLPVWDKPSAPCLSSRVPYGMPIQIETLAQIEQAEAALRRLGLRQFRVRHHGELARLEIEPGDFPTVLQARAELTAALQAAGYTHITLDLAGFQSGSLNQAMKKNGSPTTRTTPD